MGRLGVAIFFRVSVALLTATFFQPDEYFQSLEPAHRIVFGYGHLTWEWTSPQPIRSIFFPALFAPIYWILRVTGLDDTVLLVALPKVQQGLLAAMTDIAVFSMAEHVLGRRYAPIAFSVSLTSFFNVLALSRTLSNSLETSFTAIALSYWIQFRIQLDSRQPDQTRTLWQNFYSALAYAVLACMTRPTNAIVWIFLLGELFFRLRSRPRVLMTILSRCIWIGNAGATLMLLIDSLFYGQLTLTPLNFVQTNMSSVSLFYGQNPWHYYVTQALPILCTTSLPFVIHGVYIGWRASGMQRLLLTLAAFYTLVFSLAGHKEWRFLHPMLPILHVFAAKSLVDLNDAHGKQSDVQSNVVSNNPAVDITPRPQGRPRLARGAHRALLVTALPVCIYVVLFHGRAQISVLAHLRTRTDVKSLGFLMPCHSTPWQSHLHRAELDRRIWALECEPPLLGQNLLNYVDETTAFYADPAAWLRTRLPVRVDATFTGARDAWPSHIAMFGALLDAPGVRSLLTARGYAPVWVTWNGWEEDARRRGGVQIWAWERRREARFAAA